MAKVINTVFKLKRGIAARWDELNIILEQGEPGWAVDTRVLKIGDGVTPWNDLPAINDINLNQVDIQEAVNKYLEDHPVSTITDPTLSMAGYAADAKSVRDNCVFNTDCLILTAGDADDNIF